MATNLPYVKGVRTRFYNVLDKEIKNGLEIVKEDIDFLSPEECKEVKQRAGECRLTLDTYTEKLGAQSDKLAEALGETDTALTESIIDADNTLFEKSLSLCYKLKLLEDEIDRKDITIKYEEEVSFVVC